MIMLWIACGLLATGFAVAAMKWLLLKREIRQLGGKLGEIIKTDTNAHLATSTFDADIISFVESVNGVLDKGRLDYLNALRTETDLKRAITNISHDLRTPLTSAKGYLQMIKNGKLDEETTSRYLSIIQGRLDALTELMDSLFAFSRAVEGNVTLNRVNVGNVLRDALSNNFPELENKGFVVENYIPDAPVYCLCDENALARVLQNLIKNACVHGKDYLRMGLANGTIEIANKAEGLEQLDTDRIFERFYTIDAARTNKRTGLGLAIAKELTEKMGGSISAAIVDDMLVVRVGLTTA